MESLSSSVWYEESSERDFIRLVRSRVKQGLVLVCSIRRIEEAGLRPSSTKSRERKASPPPFSTTNQAGRNSSIWYEESIMRDFVHSLRSCTKGGLVLICLVRAIKQAGLRPSCTKSQKMRACPRPFGTRNQVGRTSSVRYEVKRKDSLSSSVRYLE